MTTPQHIAVVTTSFADTEPGSEAAGSFVKDFAEALSEHARVTVIAPGRTPKRDECCNGLSILRFEAPSLPLSLLTPYNPLHWPSILHTLQGGQHAVQQLIREQKVDHLLALWALPSGYWARSAWEKCGIPYSTWALGSDIWSLGNIPVVKGLLAKVLKDSHTCFADGYRLKQDVEEISGRSCEFLASSRNLPVVGKNRISNIPPYRLAFLGRWHQNKGVDLLIESLGLLNDEDWHKIEEIRLCGGGQLERIVKSGCESLKKRKRPVTIGGYLNKEAAAGLLAWSDYLLLPSRIESIPVIFSDAMQAGCPVIAMPVGDLPRLIEENKVGVLADDVTPEAFAGAMRLALSIPPKNFRRDIEQLRTQFSVQHSASRVLHFLDIQT